MPNSFMMNCVLILKEKNPEYMIISIVKSLFIYHNSLLTCISLIQGTKFQMSVLPHISYTTLKILLHDSELKLSKQCQNYFFCCNQRTYICLFHALRKCFGLEMKNVDFIQTLLQVLYVLSYRQLLKSLFLHLLNNKDLCRWYGLIMPLIYIIQTY